MTVLARERCRYTPYYCEENVWHLAQAPELAPFEREVVFVSNEAKAVALWGQRAGPDEETPVFWDYHVLLVARIDARPLVFDLDTRWGFGVPLAQYARRTFRPAPALVAPAFRSVGADPFRRCFRSDRRHMRTEDGWAAPPPPWPAVSEGSNLMRWVDMRDDNIGGVVTDLAGWCARWADPDGSGDPSARSSDPSASEEGGAPKP